MIVMRQPCNGIEAKTYGESGMRFPDMKGETD